MESLFLGEKEGGDRIWCFSPKLGRGLGKERKKDVFHDKAGKGIPNQFWGLGGEGGEGGAFVASKRRESQTHRQERGGGGEKPS